MSSGSLSSSESIHANSFLNYEKWCPEKLPWRASSLTNHQKLSRKLSFGYISALAGCLGTDATWLRLTYHSMSLSRQASLIGLSPARRTVLGSSTVAGFSARALFAGIFATSHASCTNAWHIHTHVFTKRPPIQINSCSTSSILRLSDESSDSSCAAVHMAFLFMSQ